MPDKAGQALERILAHLRDKEQNTPALPHLAPPTRAPPETYPIKRGRLLPLFAGNEYSSTAFNQHGRQRVVTAEEFVGIELFVLSFEGEREISTRPAIPVLTTGTARAVLRAVFRHFKFRDYSLGNQILSTPLLYFSYFAHCRGEWCNMRQHRRANDCSRVRSVVVSRPRTVLSTPAMIRNRPDAIDNRCPDIPLVLDRARPVGDGHAWSGAVLPVRHR